MKTYKEMEEMLSSYPIIKAEIDILKIDLEILREEATKENKISILGGRDYNAIIPGRSTAHNVVSTVEKAVVGDIRVIDKEIFEILDKIKEKERVILRMDKVLDTLSEKQRRLVELRYFKKYTVEEVADYLDVTGPTITRRSRKVLDRFRMLA